MKALEKNLKAVANRRRLAIIKHLKENREATVTDIAVAIRLSLKATSKHLGILSAVDIVDRDQRGLQMYYQLNKVTNPLLRALISFL